MGKENRIEYVEQVLGNVIEILQKAKGIKNKDFQKYGVSSSQLSQIKAGSKLPSIEKLFQLSEGLNVPVSTIMQLVEEQQKNKFSTITLMARICDRIAELEQKEETYLEKLSQLEESDHK